MVQLLGKMSGISEVCYRDFPHDAILMIVSVPFVDTTTGAQTNTAERTWKSVKQIILKRNKNEVFRTICLISTTDQW